MKKIIAFVLLFGVAITNAQTKDEKMLVDKTYLLSNTVFGTKDSLTLESLFASTATYGHSHGKLQTRKEAIDGISHNQSNYTDTAIANMKIIFANEATAIARYLFKAKENKKDGTVVPLNFSMMLVWVKEKGDWKLFGRQAVSLD